MTDDLQRWAEFLGMDEERQMAYEQGQRDAVQRIRDGVVPWLPHASDCNIRHHEGVCDCECAAVLAVIDGEGRHGPVRCKCGEHGDAWVGNGDGTFVCDDCGDVQPFPATDDEVHECDEFCAAPGGHLNIDGVADDHPAAGCVHCQDLAADADDLAREIDREEGR